jgi:lipopolysaccharide export LptBFGC system permease protein LptF
VKILDRYVLWVFVPAYAALTAALSAYGLTVPVGTLTPVTLVLLGLPFVAGIALSVTFLDLSRAQEFFALQWAGMSLRRMLFPSLALALAAPPLAAALALALGTRLSLALTFLTASVCGTVVAVSAASAAAAGPQRRESSVYFTYSVITPFVFYVASFSLFPLLGDRVGTVLMPPLAAGFALAAIGLFKRVP